MKWGRLQSWLFVPDDGWGPDEMSNGIPPQASFHPSKFPSCPHRTALYREIMDQDLREQIDLGVWGVANKG